MSTIKQVAVLGAGRMGKAIAIAFAYAGLKVDLNRTGFVGESIF
ncbi:hypothetical protein F907_02272 [Acinetobacter colistiniresistens]|uniref:3-hydroxyacyl-CoA dehydrogenase NAD binding domain-containing protein n=1 Tax=Acinetobacter colistiniresistens TaxID=280145 RepID=S3UBZ8_9GAMM|nr:3-hydroxyacyl-CoA dehydrogenase NAD-binding domain-containing protein [Acinetobacter colistiniresistens]EPG37007.1 hypothetical protein F907_02272 [Acinetobacter colistiniresistens]